MDDQQTNHADRGYWDPLNYDEGGCHGARGGRVGAAEGNNTRYTRFMGNQPQRWMGAWAKDSIYGREFVGPEDCSTNPCGGVSPFTDARSAPTTSGRKFLPTMH